MKDWKTTTLGVLGLITAIAGAAKTVLAGGNPDLAVLIPAIIAGWGLIHAKDGK